MPHYSDPLMNELVRSRIDMKRKDRENCMLLEQCRQLRRAYRFARDTIEFMEAQVEQLKEDLSYTDEETL